MIPFRGYLLAARSKGSICFTQTFSTWEVENIFENYKEKIYLCLIIKIHLFESLLFLWIFSRIVEFHRLIQFNVTVFVTRTRNSFIYHKSKLRSQRQKRSDQKKKMSTLHALGQLHSREHREFVFSMETIKYGFSRCSSSSLSSHSEEDLLMMLSPRNQVKGNIKISLVNTRILELIKFE